MVIALLFALLAALGAVTARPYPMPTELLPTPTLADFAKSTKKATGQVTRVESDTGGVVTRVINHTVTTGKYRSSSSKKPSALKGKIAGIVLGVIFGLIILIAIAIFIHKWRKRGTGHVCGEDQTPGDVVMEKKVDPDQDDVEAASSSNAPAPAPAPVAGELAYASEPANKLDGPAPDVTATKTEK